MDGRTVLIGRAGERASIERMLAGARGGESAVLVIIGEPGVGKTALLAAIAEDAGDFRVISVLGLEAVGEPPFAALYRLTTPFLPALDALPGPQREALRIAFGLASGPAPSLFLLGLAVLTLLSDAAQDKPLLCVVDDAQWLDSGSAAVLAFVARRLLADGIVMLFGLRTGSEAGDQFVGLPELELRRLAEQDAHLLASAIAPGIAGSVAQRLVTASAGSPLALIEFAGGLTHAQLAGIAALSEPLPLGRNIEEHYRQEMARLPEVARTLLLLAAADTGGDPGLIWRAAASLGISSADLRLGRVHEYLFLDAVVEFRHPLVRSAVYSAASPVRRRQAHKALGAATDPARDPDRRAWHAAAATPQPDEGIARDLEAAADRAGDRGGHSARSMFLVRAAELSEDRAQRAARFLAAAEAAIAGTEYDRAQALLDRAKPSLSGPLDQARVQRIGGVLARIQQPAAAPAMLARAARALEPFDPALARDTWVASMSAVMIAFADTRGMDITEIALGALAASGSADTPDTLLLRGLATRMTIGHAEAAPMLRRALALAVDVDRLPDGIAMWPILIHIAIYETWDVEHGRRLLTMMAARDRGRGALFPLWDALLGLGVYDAWAGDFRSAESRFYEAAAITQAIRGSPLWALDNIEPRALRGEDERVTASSRAIEEMASAHGIGAARVVSLLALVKLHVGRGRHQEALGPATRLYDEDPPGFGSHVLPDLIEAAVFTGHHDVAQAALQRLTERASASGTRWALGLMARSVALMAPGDDPDAHFARAEDHLHAAGMRIDEARAHLLHGAWLRGQQRRTGAVPHLRIAYDMFTSMGTEGYAERARQELHAAGARPARRPAAARASLTEQEELVASLAARGLTNAEIAADLFISESTVAYHLRKIFRKLGVESRRQLARHVPA